FVETVVVRNHPAWRVANKVLSLGSKLRAGPRASVPAVADFRRLDQSLRAVPCLPFQKGQNGQSSPVGKSSPSSWGQPMLPSVATTDLTPCFATNCRVWPWTLGLSLTLAPLPGRLGGLVEDEGGGDVGGRLVVRSVV